MVLATWIYIPCAMVEEYVTLLRIKRKRDEAVQQDLGEIAPFKCLGTPLADARRFTAVSMPAVQ